MTAKICVLSNRSIKYILTQLRVVIPRNTGPEKHWSTTAATAKEWFAGTKAEGV